MKLLPKMAFTAAVFAIGAPIGQIAYAQGAVQELRLGNVTANDAQAVIHERLADMLNKYSNGRFKATAHHGESLGNYAQMVRTLQAGSIHAMVMPVGFLASVVPELGLFDLPFLLPGEPAKITAFAAQSKAAQTMIGLAGEKGIHIVGFHGIGPQSFLTNFPVTKLADIQGKKFRVIPSPPRVGAYKDWGAVARPMELGEVYTALQQRTLDGMENPPDVIYKMKHHEAAKFYTITEHFAFVSGIIISKKWFDGLPADLKEVVTKAGKEAIVFADAEFTKAQATSLEAMRKAISVTNMPAAEIEKMKDLAFKGVWKTLEEDARRGPIIKQLREDVANFTKK